MRTQTRRLLICVACAIAGVWLLRYEVMRQSKPLPALTNLLTSPQTWTSADWAAIAPAAAGVEEPQGPDQSAAVPPRRSRAKRSGAQSPTGPTVGPAMSAQTNQVADPFARIALSLVGADPGAEAYWYAAINDPRLSTHERQDLIEDLNEDGLSDPDNPTQEDLPLILSRLELIETLAPAAMDQVNADAFAEAYKDLSEMANRLMRSPQPAR